MRFVITFFLALSRLSAAACGGQIVDSAAAPAAGVIVKLVSFEESGPIYTVLSGSNGAWLCPPELVPGRYLVRALRSLAEMAEASYDLTLQPNGATTERQGAPLSRLNFQLPDPPGVAKAARKSPPPSPESPSQAPLNKSAPPPVTAKAAPSPSGPPNCDECPALVDIVVDVALSKANRAGWDAGGDFPEIVLVLTSLPVPGCDTPSCRLPRAEDVEQRVEILNFPGEKKRFRGCNAQVQFLGSGDANSLHCFGGTQVAFKGVPLPKRPFRVFLADIDVFSHDLIFEHAKPIGRIRCGDFPCENQEHVGVEEFCDYRPEKSSFFRCNLVVKGGFQIAALTVVPSFDSSPFSPSRPPTETASRLLQSMRQRNTTEIPRNMLASRENAAYGRWDDVFADALRAFDADLSAGQIRCKIEDLYRVTNEYLMRFGPTGLGALDNLSTAETLMRAYQDGLLEDTANLTLLTQKLEAAAVDSWRQTVEQWKQEVRANPTGKLANSYKKQILSDFQRRGIPLSRLAEIALRDDSDAVYRELLRSGRSSAEALEAMTDQQLYDLLSKSEAQKNLSRVAAKLRTADVLSLGFAGLRNVLRVADLVSLINRYGNGIGAGESGYQLGREQFALRMADKVDGHVRKLGYKSSSLWGDIVRQRFREITDAFTPLQPPPPPEIP